MEQENRIKHLELIQTVITRMAGNSFLIKAWAVTVASALFALALKQSSAPLPTFAMLALLPTLVFWGLDAYYLREERLYRALYDRVRKASDQDLQKKENFFALSSSAIPEVKSERVDYWHQTLLAGTIFPVYLILMTAVIMIVMATRP